jgi:hypothetical protein
MYVLDVKWTTPGLHVCEFHNWRRYRFMGVYTDVCRNDKYGRCQGILLNKNKTVTAILRSWLSRAPNCSTTLCVLLRTISIRFSTRPRSIISHAALDRTHHLTWRLGQQKRRCCFRVITKKNAIEICEDRWWCKASQTSRHH